MGGLDDLYPELILDHYKNRRHRGALEAPSVTVDRNHPLCGDQVHLSRCSSTVRRWRISATPGMAVRSRRRPASMDVEGRDRHVRREPAR